MSTLQRLTTTVIALSLSAGVWLPFSAQAQNRTTLLVLSETGDPDSLRRDNRVSRRVKDAIEEQLNARGFDVYDEMAVTFETTDGEEHRLGNGELVDIARNNATYPGTTRKLLIRAAATYQVYVNITELGYSDKVRVRVSGRLIDVQSGRFLGNYELVDPGGQMRIHPTRCADRDCVLEQVGDHARPIGQAVGNELAAMLAREKAGFPDAEGNIAAGGAETYSLRFENVTEDEMMQMEAYLVDVFSGYRSHQPVQSMGTTHVYDYVSTISAAKLKRNLTRAKNELGWVGKIYMNGNVFTLKKSAMRGGHSAPAVIKEW